MRYMLVGAFTWLKPLGGKEDPELEAIAEGENLPVVDEERAEDEALDAGGPEDRGEDPGGEGNCGQHEDEAAIEERVEPELNVFRLCIPIEFKKPAVVLQALNTLYIQLRIHGYPVTRLHSDRGREYEGGGLHVRSTEELRLEPQSSGRAERAVQEIKLRMQGALHGPEKWPLACRYIHEMERTRWADREDRPLPPFGETVVKRRYMGEEGLGTTHEKVIYIAPDPDAHGHRVLKESGALAVAPFIAKTEDPITEDKWIALLAEQDREAQALDVRRRIRGKVAIKSFKVIAIEHMNAEELMING